jgi:hypothetical protein
VWVQNVIDAEAFLEGGDRDHTTSLLGDEYANNLRAREDFDSQRQELEVRLLFAPMRLILPADRVHVVLFCLQSSHEYFNLFKTQH